MATKQPYIWVIFWIVMQMGRSETSSSTETGHFILSEHLDTPCSSENPFPTLAGMDCSSLYLLFLFALFYLNLNINSKSSFKFLMFVITKVYK